MRRPTDGETSASDGLCCSANRGGASKEPRFVGEPLSDHTASTIESMLDERVICEHVVSRLEQKCNYFINL